MVKRMSFRIHKSPMVLLLRGLRLTLKVPFSDNMQIFGCKSKEFGRVVTEVSTRVIPSNMSSWMYLSLDSLFFSIALGLSETAL